MEDCELEILRAVSPAAAPQLLWLSSVRRENLQKPAVDGEKRAENERTDTRGECFRDVDGVLNGVVCLFFVVVV